MRHIPGSLRDPTSAAETITLRQAVPWGATEGGTSSGPGTERVRDAAAGRLVAEAELRTDEILNLAEKVSGLLEASVDYRLRFRVQVELDGETPPPPDVTGSVNALLREVAEGLELQGTPSME